MSGANPQPDPARGRGPDTRGIPKAVVYRLSLYLRELQRLLRDGETTVNSSRLGAMLGLSDAQVRKDLAHFGQFGHPGVGYRCEELVPALRRILGTDQSWNVALVGVGNLGRALLGYRGFAAKGFRLVAAFDADPSKVGQWVEGLAVEPLEQLEEVVRQREVALAVVAAPADSAQQIVDRLAAAGVVGVLNFAPLAVVVPPGVALVGVDLSMELEQLSFSVGSQREPRD